MLSYNYIQENLLQPVVSKEPESVITVGVYQVARCGEQSVCPCYYCRCISGSKVWLSECLPPVISVGVYQAAECG